MILIVMIFLLSLGYAILNTNLNIIGSSTINNPIWNIYFDHIDVKDGSVTPTEGAEIDELKTTVNYSVTFTTPGEYYEFTVDAINGGTIDGMVSVVSNKLNGTEITTLPNYLEYKVSYADDLDIEPNHLLAAGTSEQYKVHVGYKKDIDVSDIPEGIQTLNLSFSVTYVQSDNNVVAVNHPVQTIYTVNINSAIVIGQSIPNFMIRYGTPQEAMAAINNKPYYLKHIVMNNVIKESYVEFVVTPEMAATNPEMTVGTYTFRGFNTYENVNGNLRCKTEYYDSENDLCVSPYYEENKAKMLRVFGEENCRQISSGLDCALYRLGGRVYIDAETLVDGETFVYDDDYYCHINNTGYSGLIFNGD